MMSVALQATFWTMSGLVLLSVAYAEGEIGCFQFSNTTWELVGEGKTSFECVRLCKARGTYTIAGIVKPDCFCASSNTSLAVPSVACERCQTDAGWCGSNVKNAISVYFTKPQADSIEVKEEKPGWDTNILRRIKRQECSIGQFGLNCEKSCNCRNKASCSFEGICNDDCAAGWTGPTCSEACAHGTFGSQCNQTCYCAVATECNKSDGSCGNSGCKPGYLLSNSYCQACRQGTYGAGCTGVCHCDLASVCSPVNGTCASGKCEPGYQGEACQSACDLGKFGANCDNTCKCANNEDCNKVTGQCPSKCEAGFSGTTCSTPCSQGTYGPNCEMNCRCATLGACNSVTGTCADGKCVVEFQNGPANNCEIPVAVIENTCGTGKYGLNCQEYCHCKNDVACSYVGVCPDGCADDYRGAECSKKAAWDPLMSNMLIPILGGVAGVLLLLFIILCAILRRRNRAKKERGESQPIDPTIAQEQPADRPSSTASADSLPPGVFASIAQEPAQVYTILVSDLEENVKRSRETEKVPFLQEYQALPEGQHAKWEFGMQKNIHRDKNRFGNIIAYDHSRVPLTKKKDSASEYINANYIDGYKEPKAYIATQGPMQQTVNDFWRMCWEQNVHVIVMVTNCIEGGRPKSECYWPDLGNSKKFDDINITTTKEEIFPDYTIRTLKVERGDQLRISKHFQFTGWPDHGVPRQATPLLTLRRRVRSEMAGKGGLVGPTVVHCSAGVGRSGTYIAVDYLINQAEAEGKIDVFSCVWHMRVDRVNMVQTWDQYNFIYDALLEAVTVGQTTIPCFKFEEIYPKWLIPDPETGVNKLQQQLRILGVVKRTCLEQELDAARNPVNTPKNRREDIIPANYYRPFLATQVEGTNNYINAVFVQGYYRRDAFIVTQAPLPDTRVDFWRMMYDYDCRSIVCLQDYRKTDSSMPLPWPEPGSTVPMEYGPLSVSTLKVTTANEVTKTECVLRNAKKEEDGENIIVFSIKEFPSEEHGHIPARTMFEIKEQVQKWQQHTKNHTTVVMCKYGAHNCGLYCALDYVVDMINTEQELDVFQAVRQVQMSRPQLVNDIKDYKYLYDAAKTYLDINSAYHNFQ